jgi:hypothetical protein
MFLRDVRIQLQDCTAKFSEDHDSHLRMFPLFVGQTDTADIILLNSSERTTVVLRSRKNECLPTKA